MKRVLLAALFLLPLFLLAACTDPGVSAPADDPYKSSYIRMYSVDVTVGSAYLVEITPNGDMTIQEQNGPGEQNVRRTTAHLTPEQLTSLQAVFHGWKQLQPNYPGDWTGHAQITYEGYSVLVGDLNLAPANFTRVMATLVNLANAAKQASTRPAGTPAAASAPASR